MFQSLRSKFRAVVWVFRLLLSRNGLNVGWYGYCYPFDRACDWEPNWAEFVGHLLLPQLYRSLKCAITDHKYVSEDYCSPDSGYMGWSCARCGESHGSWMY